MKLVLLGTSGYHPSDSRQTACLMLPEIGVVLDAGSGFFRVGDYLRTDALDVFLTHAHLDHVIGLTFLFSILQRSDLKEVVVYIPADKLEAVRERLFHQSLFPAVPPCEFRSLEDEMPLGHGGCLRSFPLRHPGGSTGFRLDWPTRSMAYVTDTVAASDAAYVEAVRGVDLLVHECYFADDQEDLAELTGHSRLTPVAELAREAGVGRLILVHVNPLWGEHDLADQLRVARERFPATDWGRDRMEVEF